MCYIVILHTNRFQAIRLFLNRTLKSFKFPFYLVRMVSRQDFVFVSVIHEQQACHAHTHTQTQAGCFVCDVRYVMCHIPDRLQISEILLENRPYNK